jgi:hypothetical protein
VLGEHCVRSSAGTKGALARRHQLATKLVGGPPKIDTLFRHLTRTPLDTWASALPTATDYASVGASAGTEEPADM